MVTVPDGVTLTGSRSILARPGDEEANAVAEQHRQDVHQDLVDEPAPQALTRHVGAEDLKVLAARGAARRGDGFPDVTGEERDRRVRRVRRLMGKDELGSTVVGRVLPGVGQPLAHLIGPPSDEHGTGGRHDLRELLLDAAPHVVEDPVHRVARTSGEAVKRHAPVDDHLAVSRARVFASCSSERPSRAVIPRCG